MKEKMLKQFEFPEDLKEKIVGLVLYQRQPAKVAKEAGMRYVVVSNCFFLSFACLTPVTIMV